MTGACRRIGVVGPRCRPAPAPGGFTVTALLPVLRDGTEPDVVQETERAA